MPEETAATTESGSTNSDQTTNATQTSPTESAQSDSTSGEYQPSWFQALDSAFESEESGAADDSTPKPDNPEPPEVSKEDDSKDAPTESTDEETVKNMTPSAGAKFKEIKAEAKAARARVAELEAKLSEVEGSIKPDVAEVERLQSAIAEKESRIAEYEKELSISRFEATDEYRQSVVAPMAAIIGVVEELAKDYEVPEKVLMGLLEEPDRRKQGEMIAEVASNFSERDRFSLYQLGDDFAAVMEQRDVLRAKASEALEAREKALLSEKAKKLEESKKQWDASTKTVWETFRKSIPLPEDAKSREDFEAKVTSQVSKLDFDSLSTENKAFAAYSGAVFPQIVQRNKELSAEIGELKAALKKYQNATPGAGAGADTKPQDIDSSIGFLEALEKRFAQY